MAMTCPHCEHAIHETRSESGFGYADADSLVSLVHAQCPACRRIIVWIRTVNGNNRLIHPSGVLPRAAAPVEVPEAIAADYKEAGAVLPISPKASAALSRRCLQHLLRDAAGVQAGDLANEIQQVLDSGKLPSHVAANLDAVRVIGNFSVHPNKSNNTGEIIDVEEDEAEWTLDVLDGLFDYYYVLPARAAAKRVALEAKTGKKLRG
jgi:hypothetical protein